MLKTFTAQGAPKALTHTARLAFRPAPFRIVNAYNQRRGYASGAGMNILPLRKEIWMVV
jgi:hypothetical protein